VCWEIGGIAMHFQLSGSRINKGFGDRLVSNERRDWNGRSLLKGDRAPRGRSPGRKVVDREVSTTKSLGAAGSPIRGGEEKGLKGFKDRLVWGTPWQGKNREWGNYTDGGEEGLKGGGVGALLRWGIVLIHLAGCD